MRRSEQETGERKGDAGIATTHKDIIKKRSRVCNATTKKLVVALLCKGERTLCVGGFGKKSCQGETGGHGLGLSITKQIVKRLSGHIFVVSDRENGTTFEEQLVL